MKASEVFKNGNILKKYKVSLSNNDCLGIFLMDETGELINVEYGDPIMAYADVWSIVNADYEEVEQKEKD